MILFLAAAVSALGWSLVNRFFISPPVNSKIEVSDSLVHQGEDIQLNILNASGESGLAKTAMNFMRNRGFDVVEIANFDTFGIAKSYVVDRVGDSLSCVKVCQAMGMSADRRVVEIDSSLYLRATVVLGLDYQTLKPFQ